MKNKMLFKKKNIRIAKLVGQTVNLVQEDSVVNMG